MISERILWRIIRSNFSAKPGLQHILRCPFFLLSLISCMLLGACASTGSMLRNDLDTSTAYLGSHGEILYTRSPKKQESSAVSAWKWVGDGVPGTPSIVIDLSDQRARFYKADVEVGSAPVSTGREGYRTPAGTFSVREKIIDHISNLYGDYVDASGEVVMRNIGVQRDRCPLGAKFQGAPMPYFMRVNGAVGMHAGYLPGYPASHGCIRLPRAAAEKFFENAPHGTPVCIVH